ncbi:MAG: UDP-forming cellulose synthase catalytic subunit [Pegethrix bostrychoides GSE-TBD4-15B]|jgi:cellulose synthase (UDP-forming)|uniref:Cellulose synthase catalytic subunit [UDP-forming] n=1 Tax=Pegethrix bostrychoides GSE-TBD4-15B TaxID=2839662 RepID=A0A951PFU6_9CYAN|nr:UDP-forming cellulose synthase catalytic subunit [Pegethrix bostrychoides GSE-TBD4-15B]
MTLTPTPRPARLTRWLMALPQGLERLMPWANKRALFLLVMLMLALSIPFIVTPLELWQQMVVAFGLILFSSLVVRFEQQQPQQRVSEYLHLLLAWLSIVATLRYLFYRTAYTLNLDNWLEGFFSLLLYGAELYAIATLMLSYFQTLRLRTRHPIDLATVPQDQWFTVDVYIPTYNEDLNIVRKTALAALALDYPAPKKRVYILDDGRQFAERREQLYQMCQELGCELITRTDNAHAKAGNINHALKLTAGELILILDCDHIPSRQFLQQTVGFFYQQKVALVQTPHWFYNPDPFERNLLTHGRVPALNELFYKVIQKGNDFWNAAFFCGSAAVIRRDYVLEVGGIAVETVTEDCHTSLRLHSQGYDTVYYDKIMVAGLAPEKFSSYVGQQVRWARGMAQILRLENPLLNPRLKLTIPQRLCYFSAASHFFFGFPRLMYALAPMLFLLFGINLVRGLGVETLAYAVPHIVLGLNANYITNKAARFSFWNEIFEYAMAFQEGLVTLLAVINPKLGRFNVTDKGVSVTQRYFDWGSTRISFGLVLLLLLSLLAVPFWLVLRPEFTEATLINAFWALFNLLLLGTALLVGLEQPQLRRAHRLERRLAVQISSSQQSQLSGETLDVSESGAQILVDGSPNLPDVVELVLTGDFGRQIRLNGQIKRRLPVGEQAASEQAAGQTVLAIDFIDLTPAQHDQLVLVLYSDVAEWYTQQRQEVDRPWQSFQFLATGLGRVFREVKPARSASVHKQIRAAAQLYWNGQFYAGVATEISSRSLKIELDQYPSDLTSLRQSTQPVGILLSQTVSDPNPANLLAQVAAIGTRQMTLLQGGSSQIQPVTSQIIAAAVPVELTFPKTLDEQQAQQIRWLLQHLE